MNDMNDKPLSLDSPAPDMPVGGNESAAPPPAAPPPSRPAPKAGVFTPRLVVGIAIILAGILLTLDNLPGLGDYTGIIFRFWPLLLVFMGLAKVRQDSGRMAGGVLVAVGLYLLAITLGGRDVGEAIGPMLLVAFGIFVVVQALKRKRGPRPEGAAFDDTLQGTAIFGSFKRRPLSKAFRGGDLTAIFGGFETDLRGATLAQDEAVLDLFILFGGGEIQVPQGWDVDVRVTALFGAVEDKTPHVIREDAAPRPKLILTGLVLFGGCDIKD
jgi:predicted membrane protein